MNNFEFKISNGFVLFENATKRILIPISNIVEIRETENGCELITNNHDDKFYLNITFNALLIRLGFYSD
jgi:hypothetical protein